MGAYYHLDRGAVPVEGLMIKCSKASANKDLTDAVTIHLRLSRAGREVRRAFWVGCTTEKGGLPKEPSL
jgi:hypothetical protein